VPAAWCRTATGTLPPVTVRRVIHGVGTTLVALGILVLLFVAYELWGTGIITANHQRALRQQFEHELQAAQVAPTTTAPTVAGTPGSTLPSNRGLVPSNPSATDGQPIAILQIPAIGVDFVVVQGTGVADLQKGPGHYANTSFPGNPGNAAIAGHRTTYLHPFYNLNAVVVGDPIYVTTAQGTFRYNVTQTLVVKPTNVSVLDYTTTPTLTLTTCNPRYSAATRMVVQATLVSPVAPAPTDRPEPAAAAPSTLNPSGSDWAAALGWGLICLVVGLGIWWLHRAYRRWWIYAAGVPVGLVLLFYFFGALGPLLPAGY